MSVDRGVYDNTIINNVSIDNATLDGGGAGILVAAPFPGTGSYDNVIEHNRVEGNGLAGITIHSHAPDQDVNGNQIIGNLVGTNALDGNGPGVPGDVDFSATGTIGILIGRSYQWISQLSFTPDSWSAPLDVMRMVPLCDQTTATVTQIKRLVDLLPKHKETPLFVLDAGYDPIGLGHDLADQRCEVLTRIRDDRVFYGDAPARANRPNETGGRPPRHGHRCKCSDDKSWTTPDASLDVADFRYGKITVVAWHGLHPRLLCRGHWKDCGTPPIVKGSVIRVEVAHLPKPTGGVKKTLWLFWSGAGEPDLERCARAYLHRFDIEHGFRFVKGTLGWVTPSLCTPEQADRWTWLIVVAFTQLRLARGVIADLQLPWERPRNALLLTPCRVRRGFRGLVVTIGTPANPPKPSRAGPGRPKGTKRPPRTRYPVVKKAA